MNSLNFSIKTCGFLGMSMLRKNSPGTLKTVSYNISAGNKPTSSFKVVLRSWKQFSPGSSEVTQLSLYDEYSRSSSHHFEGDDLVRLVPLGSNKVNQCVEKLRLELGAGLLF